MAQVSNDVVMNCRSHGDIFRAPAVQHRNRLKILQKSDSVENPDQKQQTDSETMLQDMEIIQQIVDGDANAFELLLRKYQAHVLKIVKKHIPPDHIDDVAHDVFLRAYQSLPKFKQSSPFQNWLSSIAVRTCCDFWRAQYRSKEMPMSSLSEKHRHWLVSKLSQQSSRSYQEEAEREHAREVLDWALNKLSAEERTVIELVYLEELSGKEAAKLLGWSVANVKIRSFRARKKMQKLLKHYTD